MADIFEVAWEREAVIVALCVAPVVIVAGNRVNIVVLQTFGGVDGLQNNSVFGFVVWRAVKNLDFGGTISLNAGDEISKGFFLVVFCSDAFAQGIEVAIEIVIVDVREEFERDLVNEEFGGMGANFR